MNIPLGAAGLALVARFIPGDRASETRPLDWPGFLVTSVGLASMLYGLERIAHPQDGALPTVALLGAGVLIGWLAVRHLARAKNPLLDLAAFKVQTFAISTLSAGTIFRVSINATPFLLPLMFQVGFGLRPVDAGMLILAYFLGNLGMKTVTTPTLKRFGFRSVLVVNGVIASLSIMACAAISPQTPQALVVALMLIAGLTRSMQFTALNTLAFADIASAQRSSAATLSSMLQQVAMVFGVAVAAAGGAGYVAKNMVAAPPPQIVDSGPEAPAIALQDVLVLSGDVPMGGPLANNITWQSWPANGINANFITRAAEPDALEKLKGGVARVAMYAGEPLRRSKLIGEGQSFMSSILPSGMRAVATAVSADTSAGGFILPNDFVDVIMTRRADPAAGGSGFTTETILKNIRVLAIDQTIQEDEEGKRTRVGQTATLELTPQQAEIITVAQQMADRLTLALRSITDTQEKNLG
ncbi:MAG: Flp pilus assembly protein CpaB, partial [Mesorhizobium sp.]